MAVSDFLSNLGNPNTLFGIGSAVMGLNEAKGANQSLQSAYAPNSYDAMYQQLATQLQGLTGELADTNNPQFQARVNARRDEIMRQYEQQLRQQQAVEARRYGRTGMGMINPERRDEGLSRSLAAFRSQAEAQARAEAMGELVQAAKTGTGVAQGVAMPGAQRMQGQQVASANAGNAYDSTKKNTYLALASQVLGPLLKGVDFNKMVGATGQSGGVQSAPGGQPSPGGQSSFAGGGAPQFDAGMNFPGAGGDSGGAFDPGYGYGAQQGGGGMDFPSFDMGQSPASGGDPGGMYDPGYGYGAQPDFSFPTTGGDAGGSFDPGYGYGAPQFDSSSFDFSPGNFDMGGWDYGFGGY